MFVDEGPPMASLLGSVSASPAYVQELLTAAGHTVRTRPAKQDLLEPLSDRELDVLRLLASDLSGPAIARELVVSLNTVRTHTKSIYTKLAVNSRRAAVRRAEELNLLARRPR
jgi:LuxR family maltose regulon positive regulatory protein